MTTITTPETTTRYRWTEAENEALVAAYHSTEARSPERKAAMQEFADKTGIGYDSIVARVYALLAQRGESPGEPVGTRAPRANRVEALNTRIEQIDARIASLREERRDVKAKISEATKAQKAREKAVAQRIKARQEAAQAKLDKAQAALAAAQEQAEQVGVEG